MKIFIYTVATNDLNSFSCTELLYKSLKKFFILDFDFRIIIGKDKQYVCSPELMSYLLPVDSYDHIFKFKYSSYIPYNDYSYFIYLDSDILWMFDQLNIDFIKYQYIYTEGNIYKRPWSKYWPPKDKNLLKNDSMKNYQFGINAGFFALNQFYMKQLYNFMSRRLHPHKIHGKNRFLEQNMFNLFIYKNFYMNNNKDQIRIFTENVVCKTNKLTPYYSNKIYHFDGDMCHMDQKLERMKSFLNKNKIIL